MNYFDLLQEMGDTALRLYLALLMQRIWRQVGNLLLLLFMFVRYSQLQTYRLLYCIIYFVPIREY